jgi:hypothetical protein
MTGLRDVSPQRMLGLTRKSQQRTLRAQVDERLRSLRGRHVVFVTYSADHSFQDEWVYNAADVDEAPIVWCRASGPTDAVEIIRYYQGRQFWTASVGRSSVQLSRYIPELAPSAAKRERENPVFENTK